MIRILKNIKNLIDYFDVYSLSSPFYLCIYIFIFIFEDPSGLTGYSD